MISIAIKMVSKKISDCCYPITVKMGKEMKNGTLVLNVLHGKELEIEYAKKLNMNILVISALTNFAAGLKDTILTHEDVLVNAKKIGQDFAKLLLETVINLD